MGKPELLISHKYYLVASWRRLYPLCLKAWRHGFGCTKGRFTEGPGAGFS